MGFALAVHFVESLCHVSLLGDTIHLHLHIVATNTWKKKVASHLAAERAIDVDGGSISMDDYYGVDDGQADFGRARECDVEDGPPRPVVEGHESAFHTAARIAHDRTYRCWDGQIHFKPTPKGTNGNCAPAVFPNATTMLVYLLTQTLSLTHEDVRQLLKLVLFLFCLLYCELSKISS
jgi:hypothetical protein